MSGQPKYIRREVLEASAEHRERAIFNDIFPLIKQGAPWGYIGKGLKQKYNFSFESRKEMSAFIRRIINRFAPNCITCGEPRYLKSSLGKFTLFCEKHFKESERLSKGIQRSWEERLAQDVLEGPEYYKFETHGDISDKVLGMHDTLGTTDIGSHRSKNFKREREIISTELKKLGLRNEKKSK